jgi:hypothetical protein
MCCTLQAEKSICTPSSLQGINVVKHKKDQERLALSMRPITKLQGDTWQTHNVDNVLPWCMAALYS